MTRLKWKLISVSLEIVLILTQDGCTVRTERTIPMVLLCDVGHIKSCFGPFGDGVSVSVR
jgi:hypothetical protein